MPNVVIANRISEFKSLYDAILKHYFSLHADEDIQPFKVMDEETDFMVDLSYGALKYSVTNPDRREIKFNGAFIEGMPACKEIAQGVSKLVASASGDDGFNELLMSYVEKNFHEVYINPHTNRSSRGYYMPEDGSVAESVYFLNTANVPRTVPKYLNVEGFKDKLDSLNQGLHNLAGSVLDEVKKLQADSAMYLEDKYRGIDAMRHSPSRFDVVNRENAICYENNSFTYAGAKGKITLSADYSNVNESRILLNFGLMSCFIKGKTVSVSQLTNTFASGGTLVKTFENPVFSEKLVSLANQAIEAFKAVHANFTPNVVEGKDIWENYPNYIDFYSYVKDGTLTYNFVCSEAEFYSGEYNSDGVSLYEPLELRQYRPNCLVGFGGKNLEIESL